MFQGLDDIPIKEGFSTLSKIFVTPEQAGSVIKYFFDNEEEHRERYSSEWSRKKITAYKKSMLSGEWDSFSTDKSCGGSVLIFFEKNEKDYAPFYEGKHRLISLSELSGSIGGLFFLVAVNFPGDQEHFKSTIVKKHKNLYKYLIEKMFLPGIGEIPFYVKHSDIVKFVNENSKVSNYRRRRVVRRKRNF